MKWWMLTLVFALTVGGCIADDGSGSNGTYTADPYGCQRHTTCGSCTPVLGCGWCTIADKGLCVADPDQCAAAPAFQWTWELSGCPPVPDGSAAADTAADAGAAD
jgi:hypothetical protein